MPDTMTVDETLETLKEAGQTEDEAQRSLHRIFEMDQKRRETMSPPGALYLPERLDKARLDYGIPDRAFSQMALSDRLYVYRPKSMVHETYVEGGLVVRPEVNKMRERGETPVGILVAWGLRAQDELVPLGLELGMIVGFVAMAPWMMPIGRDPVDNTEDHVIVLRSDHLVGCETLETERRSMAAEGKDLVTVMETTTGRGTILRTHTIAGLEKTMPVLQEDY